MGLSLRSAATNLSLLEVAGDWRSLIESTVFVLAFIDYQTMSRHDLRELLWCISSFIEAMDWKWSLRDTICPGIMFRSAKTFLGYLFEALRTTLSDGKLGKSRSREEGHVADPRRMPDRSQRARSFPYVCESMPILAQS